MDYKEFKLFYKNKSPLLFSYLIEEVISSNIAQNITLFVFAKYYRIKDHKPESLTREKWLLLITRKSVIDFYNYRITEEGQEKIREGRGSFESSKRVEELQSQFTEWISSLGEAEQSVINDLILSELPVPDLHVSIKDQIRNKIKAIEEKYAGKKK